MRPETQEATTFLRIVNSRPDELKFFLEPWGEEYPMPPGEKFELVAKGPMGGQLELEYAEGHIMVWGWPGSVVALLNDGNELGRGDLRRGPVPPTPPRSQE
jgi:hypothetical protein